jgi:hypothetical protein
MRQNKSRIVKRIFTVLLVIGYIPLLGFSVLVIGSGYLGNVVRGPKIAQSVANPSIDPPNQSLYIERFDKIHYMRIATLAEDVDSIKEVVWSPDGRIVVFHSHHYLTATLVGDWQTVRIYLGSEWRRSAPDRRSTFTSGGVKRRVKAIEFPQAGSFTYRLEGDDKLHEVPLGSTLQS